MKDVFKQIEIEGNGKTVRYPFSFNINVVEEIQAKYSTFDGNGEKIKDGLSRWAELISEKSKEETVPDMKAMIFMIQAAINEGIDMENDPESLYFSEERKENTRKKITEKQAGRILTSMGQDAMRLISGTIVESNGVKKETSEKNLGTGQNLN